MTATAEVAGNVYGALISEQLTQERARKASIEQRGITIVTSSGALVTLLFALPALATKAQATYVLPEPARWLLVACVALFILASLAGLATNFPMAYREVTGKAFDKLVTPEAWTKDKTAADRRAAAARVAMIKSGRTINRAKAWFLIVGLFFEVLAVIVLALAAANILLTTS